MKLLFSYAVWLGYIDEMIFHQTLLFVAASPCFRSGFVLLLHFGSHSGPGPAACDSSRPPSSSQPHRQRQMQMQRIRTRETSDLLSSFGVWACSSGTASYRR